jgi:DNA polymerase-3 subunit delta
MPDLTREELWRQLKQNIIAPVYVLFGTEHVLRDKACGEIIKHSFSENDLRDFNIDEVSLNNNECLESAIAAAQQLPMMSARRVVKITDVRVTSTANRDTLKEDSEDILGRYFADPSPSTVLIFVGDELNGNRKISKLLAKHAVCVKFERLNETDINGWIKKQFDEQGSQIDNIALRRLAELVGTDLRRLTNEIAKLSTAALPSTVVKFELVDELVPNTNEIDNFALTDAILSGRRQHALRILKKILDDGAEPVQLLGLLLYNFRRLFMAKEMMARGQDRRDVAGILKMRYRNQEDFLAAARRADRNRLITVFDRLAKTDVAMKTSLGGGGDQGTRMLIEILVCELALAMSR